MSTVMKTETLTEEHKTFNCKKNRIIIKIVIFCLFIIEAGVSPTIFHHAAATRSINILFIVVKHLFQCLVGGSMTVCEKHRPTNRVCTECPDQL